MRDAAPSVEGCVRFRISTCREQVIKSGEFGTGMVTYPSRVGTGKIPGDLFVVGLATWDCSGLHQPDAVD